MRTHPVTGVKKLHNGIDIGIPIGTPIFAPDAGTVTGHLTNEAGGKQMIITHDTGIKTGYAHLDFRYVPEGAKVKQGQQIARSGNTGRTTGAHLHFTIKDKNGNFVDPQKFLYGAKKKRGNLAALLTALGFVAAIYGIYEINTKTKKKGARVIT